jgi:hypothetical protein
MFQAIASYTIQYSIYSTFNMFINKYCIYKNKLFNDWPVISLWSSYLKLHYNIKMIWLYISWGLYLSYLFDSLTQIDLWYSVIKCFAKKLLCKQKRYHFMDLIFLPEKSNSCLKTTGDFFPLQYIQYTLQTKFSPVLVL